MDFVVYDHIFMFNKSNLMVIFMQVSRKHVKQCKIDRYVYAVATKTGNMIRVSVNYILMVDLNSMISICHYIFRHITYRLYSGISFLLHTIWQSLDLSLTVRLYECSCRCGSNASVCWRKWWWHMHLKMVTRLWFWATFYLFLAWAREIKQNVLLLHYTNVKSHVLPAVKLVFILTVDYS